MGSRAEGLAGTLFIFPTFLHRLNLAGEIGGCGRDGYSQVQLSIYRQTEDSICRPAVCEYYGRILCAGTK